MLNSAQQNGKKKTHASFLEIYKRKTLIVWEDDNSKSVETKITLLLFGFKILGYSIFEDAAN